MGIKDIDILKGEGMESGQGQDPQQPQQPNPAGGTPAGPEPTPEQTGGQPQQSPASDKPQPEPVQEVNDSELDQLEDVGASDVSEKSPEEAEADETVDNQENDT